MEQIKTFVMTCLNRGFKLSLSKDGKIIKASKKNSDGINLRFELTKFAFDFGDGRENEPKIQVFENNQTDPNWIWRLSEFEIHE